MTEPASYLEIMKSPYRDNSQLVTHMIDRTVPHSKAWQTFLNSREFLCCLSQKLKRNSPTFVEVGPPENPVTMPYGSIPTQRSLTEEVPPAIQAFGPRYFELSCEIAEIFYDMEGFADKRKHQLRIFAAWPKAESKKDLEKLVDEVFGITTQ